MAGIDPAIFPSVRPEKREAVFGTHDKTKT